MYAINVTDKNYFSLQHDENTGETFYISYVVQSQYWSSYESKINVTSTQTFSQFIHALGQRHPQKSRNKVYRFEI